MQLEIGGLLVQKKLPDGGEEKPVAGPCLPKAGDEHVMQSQRSLNTAPGFLTQAGGDYIRDSRCVKALGGIWSDAGVDRPAGSRRYSRQDAGATFGGELRCGGQLSCFRRVVLEACCSRSRCLSEWHSAGSTRPRVDPRSTRNVRRSASWNRTSATIPFP